MQGSSRKQEVRTPHDQARVHPTCSPQLPHAHLPCLFWNRGDKILNHPLCQGPRWIRSLGLLQCNTANQETGDHRNLPLGAGGQKSGVKVLEGPYSLCLQRRIPLARTA